LDVSSVDDELLSSTLSPSFDIDDDDEEEEEVIALFLIWWR
jgi:hypothetical protein